MAERIVIGGDPNWSNDKRIQKELQKHLPIECVIQTDDDTVLNATVRQVAASMGIPVEVHPVFKAGGHASGTILKDARMMLEGLPTMILTFDNDSTSDAAQLLKRHARAVSVPEEQHTETDG